MERTGRSTKMERTGRSTIERRASGLAAKIRSRSASISRGRGRGRAGSGSGNGSLNGSVNGSWRYQPQQDEETAILPAPSFPTNQVAGQIENIIERHQLALKKEMLEFVETQGNEEIKFWKSEAVKLKKKISLLEKESREAGEALNKGGNSKESETQLLEKVSLLEIYLQDRDTQINALRRTMETQEKASEERVRLLENQLERLVELTTVVRSSSFQRPPSIASTQPLSDSDTSKCSDLEKGSGDDRPTTEISALEQLLARVLAEKDKLQFENENLRSVVKGNALTSTDVVNDDDKASTPDDSTKHKAQHPNETMYQLSCRNCAGKHFIGTTSGDLKKKANKHFSTVWEVVKTTHGKSSSFKESDENTCSPCGSPFSDSFLAHHLAAHCRDMECEKDVRKWCKKNVKLEKIVAGASEKKFNQSCEF